MQRGETSGNRPSYLYLGAICCLRLVTFGFTISALNGRLKGLRVDLRRFVLETEQGTEVTFKLSKFEPFSRRSEVIFVKGALNGLLALVSLIIAAVSFYLYTRGTGTTLWLVGIIVGVVLTLVFGGMFLSGRVNRTEEIHITE